MKALFYKRNLQQQNATPDRASDHASSVEGMVYARHGREQMGWKSPVHGTMKAKVQANGNCATVAVLVSDISALRVVERVASPGPSPNGHMQIARGGLEVGVTEHALQGDQIGAQLKVVGG